MRLDRRSFLSSLAASAALPALPRGRALPPRAAPAGTTKRLWFAVKYSMVEGDAPMREKLALLAELGFDGVELDSPNSYALDEVLEATRGSGLAIHGVVDSTHWSDHLSAADEAVRARARDALETALRDSHAYGGSSVLLVPGVVDAAKDEGEEQVAARSLAILAEVIPLAARSNVRILIENVWNRFCYDHEGGSEQGAERLAAYIDAAASPWVGSYFDIGNHRKYGHPEQWIRTLGRRIVKCDVKDWSRDKGWVGLGEGDVDWPAVRAALAGVGFSGWCTAEVRGGDRAALAEIKARMDRLLLG